MSCGRVLGGTRWRWRVLSATPGPASSSAPGSSSNRNKIFKPNKNTCKRRYGYTPLHKNDHYDQIFGIDASMKKIVIPSDVQHCHYR